MRNIVVEKETFGRNSASWIIVLLFAFCVNIPADIEPASLDALL